jgi:hypothetical protein
MRGNAHVRFGGRAGETDRRRRQHRAPAPPNHVVQVRREAPFVRVGCKDPPPACRSRPVKLEAA